MRRAAVVIAALAGVASAGPNEKPEKVDLAPALDKLDVYRDDLGTYYVLPKDGAYEKTEEANQWIFYGDAKTMYRQRVLSASSGGTPKSRRWMLWGPRAIAMVGGYLELGDKPTISCRHHDKGAPTPLVQLSADEARSVLAKAKVFGVMHQRNSHLLARDDEGTYYYVDELRSEYGGNGYRVFAGLKGAMKELPVTNIVRDSAGEIFGTKSGLIKVVKDGNVYWIKNGKKIELTSVDVQKDHYLIYRELGIYASLGAVCEDM
jgi:hypothetical protein